MAMLTSIEELVFGVFALDETPETDDPGFCDSPALEELSAMSEELCCANVFSSSTVPATSSVQAKNAMEHARIKYFILLMAVSLFYKLVYLLYLSMEKVAGSDGKLG